MARNPRQESLSRVTSLVPNSPLFIRVKSRHLSEDLDLAETGRSLETVELNTISGSISSVSPPSPDQESYNGDAGANNNPSAANAQHPSIEDPKQDFPDDLHAYLDCMYFMGVSPLNHTDGNQGCLANLHKAVFWLFSLVAIMHGLKQAKYFAITIIHEEGLVMCVTFACLVISCIGRAYFVKVLGFNTNKIHKMLKDITTGSESNHNFPRKLSVTHVALTLAFSSWICPLILCVFGRPSIKEWSLQESILIKSFDLAQDMFVWGGSNDTKDYVYYEFRQNLTPKTIIFGTLEIIIQFCGNLHDCIFADMLLLSALVLHKLTNNLNTKIKNADPPTNNADNLACLWKDYKFIKSICKSANECTGGLLIFMHFGNVVLFGYTLLTLLRKWVSAVTLIFAIIKIMKSSYMYYLAVRVSRTSSSLQSWIHERGLSAQIEQVNIDGVLVNVSVPVILEELKMNNIGLGEGAFRIDMEFILKLATLVTSYFMFLAKELEE